MPEPAQGALTEPDLTRRFTSEVQSRIEALDERAAAGAFDAAIALFVSAIERGGVVQAFGTGHSEALAMELAGRAGGFVPSNKLAMRDLILFGGEPVIRMSCPRCGARYMVTREAMEAHIAVK